jgi:GrpB-like predicted nucleotidyltransferase (UPF0157 family)
MPDMAGGTISFRPSAEFRAGAERAVALHSAEIDRLLPGAEIEHVGSTSIPGALTRGDVDLLVRVPAERFEEAVERLRGRYAVHQPENWSPTFASFAEPGGDVGIQLAIEGSHDATMFERLYALFRDRPELLEDYNELKRRHEGGDSEAYWREKQEFIERLVGR